MEFTPVADEVRNVEMLVNRPPEEVLLVVGRTFFRAFERPEVRSLLRVLVSEATRRPGALDHFAEHGLLRAINALGGYLAHHVRAGRLRPHDAAASARIFLSSLITYMIWREVMPPLGKGLPEPEEYLDTVVGVILDGLGA